MVSVSRMLIAAAIALSVAACSPENVPVSLEDGQKVVVCAGLDASLSALSSGGSPAVRVATMVRDNSSDPNVQSAAAAVIANPADAATRIALSQALGALC